MNPLDTHRKIVEGTKRANPAVSFGVNFAAGMGLFAFLGWKLDQRRGPDALGFTMAGVVLGFIYGGYELWKIVRSDNARAAAEKPSVPPGPSTGS